MLAAAGPWRYLGQKRADSRDIAPFCPGPLCKRGYGCRAMLQGLQRFPRACSLDRLQGLQLGCL